MVMLKRIADSRPLFRMAVRNKATLAIMNMRFPTVRRDRSDAIFLCSGLGDQPSPIERCPQLPWQGIRVELTEILPIRDALTIIAPGDELKKFGEPRRLCAV